MPGSYPLQGQAISFVKSPYPIANSYSSFAPSQSVTCTGNLCLITKDWGRFPTSMLPEHLPLCSCHFFFSKYCLMKLLLLKCNQCVNCLKAVSIHRYILCLSAGACLPGWPAHLQYWVQCLVQRKHLINRCWMNEWVAGQPSPFWLNNHSSLQSILSVPCPLVSPLLVLGDSTRVTVWMPF